MRRPLVLALFLTFAVAFLGACATAPDGASSGSPAAAAQAKTPPPADNALSKVRMGMNDTQVRNLLGNPTNSNAYMTGKAFIPFYFGPDTHRTDWMYKGMGRVVFSRNRWSGGLKVIEVTYKPSETAGM